MQILNNEDNSGPNLVGESNRARIARLLEVWKNSPENFSIQDAIFAVPKSQIPPSSYKQMASFFTQFYYLFGR